jgi:hypothetical protein
MQFVTVIHVRLGHGPLNPIAEPEVKQDNTSITANFFIF